MVFSKLRRYGGGFLGGFWCEVAHGRYHRQIGYGAYMCRLCDAASALRAEIAGVCAACNRPNAEPDDLAAARRRRLYDLPEMGPDYDNAGPPAEVTP